MSTIIIFYEVRSLRTFKTKLQILDSASRPYPNPSPAAESDLLSSRNVFSCKVEPCVGVFFFFWCELAAVTQNDQHCFVDAVPTHQCSHRTDAVPLPSPRLDASDASPGLCLCWLASTFGLEQNKQGTIRRIINNVTRATATTSVLVDWCWKQKPGREGEQSSCKHQRRGE